MDVLDNDEEVKPKQSEKSYLSQREISQPKLSEPHSELYLTQKEEPSSKKNITEKQIKPNPNIVNKPIAV